ncbi:MAG: hypothetical protein J2P51_12985, partial [Hyphomicrobiaceae bacterium]|nr:hypothetical protein [Hyphomicrobiaceae bacterium]
PSHSVGGAPVAGRRSGAIGVNAMGAVVGGPIVFAATMPTGVLPAALGQEGKGARRLQLPGNDPNLTALSERPLGGDPRSAARR